MSREAVGTRVVVLCNINGKRTTLPEDWVWKEGIVEEMIMGKLLVALAGELQVVEDRPWRLWPRDPVEDVVDLKRQLVRLLETRQAVNTLQEQELPWAMRRYLVRISEPRMADSSFWTLLMCLQRVNICLPRDLRILLFNVLLECRYTDDVGPAMARVLAGQKWLPPAGFEKNERLRCIDKSCNDMVDLMNVFSLGRFEAHLRSHFLVHHNVALTTFLLQSATCLHVDRDHQTWEMEDDYGIATVMTKRRVEKCKDCGKYLADVTATTIV